MAHQSDQTPTERTAHIVWMMAGGWTPTTSEVSRRFDVSWGAAAKIMERLSLVLPLYRTEERPGRWRLDRTELLRWLE